MDIYNYSAIYTSCFKCKFNVYIIFDKNCTIICVKGDIMFDVKKPEMVNKTFRLPLELVKQLEIIAQQNGVSMNNLVLQCCKYALDNIEETYINPTINNHLSLEVK